MKTNFEIIDWITQFGISKQYAGDVLTLAIYLIASIFIIILIKKKNLGPFMLSVYVAYVIFSFSYFIPKATVVGVAYFFILVFLISMLMRRIVSFHIGGGQIAIAIQSLLIALLTCAMITSLVLSWLPPENLSEFFTQFTKQLFTSDVFKLTWTVVPLLLLAFVKKYRY